MHAVPVVARLGQEALAMQHVQVPGSLPQAGSGQGGGGVAVNGGTRMQAQALEEFPVARAMPLLVICELSSADGRGCMMLGMHPWTGLADDVRLGLLTQWVSAELVDEVLAECG